MENISEYAKLLGKRGGLKTKENQGKDYFKKISKKGVEKRWGKKLTK